MDPALDLAPAPAPAADLAPDVDDDVLRGAWQHPPYFHDGSAATLAEVVTHYDAVLDLGLSPPQRSDLVHYLRSL